MFRDVLYLQESACAFLEGCPLCRTESSLHDALAKAEIVREIFRQDSHSKRNVTKTYTKMYPYMLGHAFSSYGYFFDCVHDI